MATERDHDPAPSAHAATAAYSSSAILMLVNLIPVAGVVWAGWDVFQVLALFWAENLVIGAFAIAKLLLVDRRIVPALFFVLHFGGFCFGHGVLLTELFGPPPLEPPTHPLAAMLGALGAGGPLLTVGALVASHGWSFLSNTLHRREYAHVTAATAMRMPYQRIVITQVALIAGGALVEFVGEPLLGLVVLVLIKTAFDLRAHRREHNALARGRVPHGV